MPEGEKLLSTTGILMAILNPEREGRLLLRQREEQSSLIPGKSFLGNWELPGGGARVPVGQVPYDYLLQEGLRELEEEVGIHLEVRGMPAMYSTLYAPARDHALVVPQVAIASPTKGKTRWASVEEMNQLARDYVPADIAKAQGLSEARGLVSGWGGRMHCACLAAMRHSPNQEFVLEARRTLDEIVRAW